MQAEHLIAFNIALFAALLSPGPALLVAIRGTVTNGRAAGVATGLGLGLAAASWTLTALLGLDTIFRLFPWAYTAFRILVALYLICLAWMTWRHASAPLCNVRPGRHRAFPTGVLVNLGNPKSVLFAGAVLIVVFPGDPGILEMAVISVNHLLVEWSFYTILALVMGHRRVGRGYPGAKPVLDRMAATLLGALGLRLLTDR